MIRTEIELMSPKKSRNSMKSQYNDSEDSSFDNYSYVSEKEEDKSQRKMDIIAEQDEDSPNNPKILLNF